MKMSPEYLSSEKLSIYLANQHILGAFAFGCLLCQNQHASIFIPIIRLKFHRLSTHHNELQLFVKE